MAANADVAGVEAETEIVGVEEAAVEIERSHGIIIKTQKIDGNVIDPPGTKKLL